MHNAPGTLSSRYAVWSHLYRVLSIDKTAVAMDGTDARARTNVWQDYLPEQEVSCQAWQLRLGGSVLQLQGVGCASAYQPQYRLYVSN